MKMTVAEALGILEIHVSPVTKAMIKSTHKRLVSKYHPDRNPTGHEMTQKINVARDFLVKQPEPIHVLRRQSSTKTEDEISASCVRGMWILKMNNKTIITGDTFRFKEILKINRFRWSPENRHWWREGIIPIEIILERANM